MGLADKYIFSQQLVLTRAYTAATLRFHARTFTVSEVPRRINNGSLRVLTQAEAPGCLEAIRVAGSCSIAIRSIRITEVIIGT